MNFPLVSAAAALLLCVAPGGVSAQSSKKPENPSAFASQVVTPDAKDGGAGGVSVPASSAPQALSSTIKTTREDLGSSPTPHGED